MTVESGSAAELAELWMAFNSAALGAMERVSSVGATKHVVTVNDQCRSRQHHHLAEFDNFHPVIRILSMRDIFPRREHGGHGESMPLFFEAGYLSSHESSGS